MQEYIGFLDKYPRKSYAAGEQILNQHDAVHNVHIIQEGFAKVYDINTQGEVKILLFLSKHEVFPIDWIFFKSEKSIYFYEALTDCEVILVPKEDFIRHTTTNITVAVAQLRSLASVYLDFLRRVDGLTQLKAEQKVLYALDFLCRRFGGSANIKRLDDVKISIHVTQADIAAFLGLTRETVSTIMHSLLEQGLLHYEGSKTIAVNDQKIRDLIDP